MNGQSATDRFKNRKRPTVNRQVDEVSVAIQESATVPQKQGGRGVESSSSSSLQSLEILKAQLEALPKTASNFQLRFTEETKTEIQGLARDEKLTPETLLEGIWAVVKDDPIVMRRALEQAKGNLISRKKAATLKNTITRIENALNT